MNNKNERRTKSEIHVPYNLNAKLSYSKMKLNKIKRF